MKHLLFVSVVLVWLATGCAREDSPRRPHADAVTSSEDGAAAPQKTATQPVPTDFVTEFKARLDRRRLDGELRKQLLEDRHSLYAIIGKAGDIVEAAAKDDENRQEILNTFSAVVTAGCGLKLDTCTYARLFKDNRGTSTLLLALADRAAEIKLRYRFLSLAFALVGRVDDPRIGQAYVQTAPAYEAELRRTSDRVSRLLLEQHLDVFEISFTQLRKTLNPKERDEIFSGLENAFGLWNFGRARNVENSSREAALFAIVASRFFDDQSKLENQIALLAAEKESALVKFDSIPMASRRAFGIRDQLPKDLHTFLFDSLWTDRLTPSEVDALWNAYLDTLSSTGERLQARNSARDALLNYSRIRLLLTANEANAVITEFFTTPGKFVTSDAFYKAREETSRAQTIWNDGKKRFETLRSFNEQHLRPADAEDKSNREISGFFASIDRSIKLISTYPSMLVMSYHLARLGFSLKIQMWRSEVKIESGQILDWFFDGTLDPWMPYSDDYKKLSKSEISIVFYYALEMGVLSSGGVELEHLFKMLTEQMAGPIRLETERVADIYEQTFLKSTFASEFHRFCEERVRSKGTPIATPIDLQKLAQYSILGIPEGGSIKLIHPVFHAGWSFFEMEGKTTLSTLDDNLDIVRLELTPKIDRVRMMARLSEDYLDRHEIADRSGIMTGIEQKILPLEAVRKRFYSIIFKLTKLNTTCSENLIAEELASQRFVIAGLVNHFRSVHAAMNVARTTARDGEVLKQEFGYAGKTRLAELENHERGLGYTKEMYRVSQLQIMLRIKDLLENGYTENGQMFAPRRTRGSILVPARLRDISYEYRRRTLRLDWSDDVDEFVASGIQQTFDTKLGFVEWAGLASYAISGAGAARSLSSLAKAGIVQTEEGPQRMHPKEIIRFALEMEKHLEIEGTEWMNVLPIIGKVTRVESPGGLAMFAWEESSHAWRGSLDFIFENLRSDKLGQLGREKSDPRYARYHRRKGPREEFVKHTEAVKSFGEPTLKIPAKTLTELSEFYRQRMDEQMNLVADTIDEIDRLKPLHAEHPEVFPSWRLYTSRPAPKMPLLTKSEFETFHLDIDELVRQTGYVIPLRIEKALKR